VSFGLNFQRSSPMRAVPGDWAPLHLSREVPRAREPGRARCLGC